MARDAQLRLRPGTAARLQRARLVLPFTPVLAEPTPRAPQLSEMVYGQVFDIHERKGRWAYGRVKSLAPGSRRTDYVGWVDGRGLQEAATRPTHGVSVLSAPVFHRAELKSHIVMSLPFGSRLAPLSVEGDYVQIGSGAYLHARHVRPIGDTEPFAAAARRYLGQPYVWGGNGARGVDCSGLVQMALLAAGVEAPRDADQQEAALGDSVPLAAVTAGQGEPGDLLFWPGHVGLLGTAHTLLHANAYHMGVVEEPLGPALRRMADKGVELRSVKRL